MRTLWRKSLRYGLPQKALIHLPTRLMLRIGQKGFLSTAGGVHVPSAMGACGQ
jgi:hypothetical protein